MNFVPLRAQTDSTGRRQQTDKDATFGQRRSSGLKGKGSSPSSDRFDGERRRTGGGFETSWVPSSSSKLVGNDDMLVLGGPDNSKKRQDRRKGVESFGAGMEKGGSETINMLEGDRRGRTERRKGIRSGSKNTFRRI